MAPKKRNRVAVKIEICEVPALALAEVFSRLGCIWPGRDRSDGRNYAARTLVNLEDATDCCKESVSNEVQERNKELINAILVQFPTACPGKRIISAALKISETNAVSEDAKFSGLPVAEVPPEAKNLRPGLTTSEFHVEGEEFEAWVDEEATKVTILWDAVWDSCKRAPTGSKNLAVLRLKILINEGQAALPAKRLSSPEHEALAAAGALQDIEISDSDENAGEGKEHAGAKDAGAEDPSAMDVEGADAEDKGAEEEDLFADDLFNMDPFPESASAEAAGAEAAAKIPEAGDAEAAGRKRSLRREISVCSISSTEAAPVAAPQPLPPQTAGFTKTRADKPPVASAPKDAPANKEGAHTMPRRTEPR